MFRRSRGQGDETLIFFATDIHGSDVCFRKFVNAGKFYSAQVLIMGGDLTGKMLIPITPNGSGWQAEYAGREQHFASAAEVADFERLVADTGAYTYRCDEDELARYEEQGEVERLIAGIAIERVRRWVQLADERLAGTDIQCLMAPGNDDMAGVEAAIETSAHVVNPDGRKLELRGGHEFVATGFSNITPWHTERELPEDDLEQLLVDLFEQCDDLATTVASLHVPPFDSGLDSAPRLSSDFRVQTRGGEPDMIPVGSTAVRRAVERYQPLLAVHGHIHESQGRLKLGRTVCLNPGSEYTEGVLKGALIRLTRTEVKGIQFIKG
jgi:Icc-related predicted phosphoesterase